MPLRLLMLGTGPFAVPTFRRLLDSPHAPLALVTKPPRPAHVHGKKSEDLNPMRRVAEERGLMVLTPETINDAEVILRLKDFQADLLVVCDYGQILSPGALAAARLGGINLHASLLPKYRGAAPINWAIFHGEAETGISVIHMTPRLDGGPLLAQVRTPIGPDETAPELEARLAESGAAAMMEVIAGLERGDAQPIKQNDQQATKAPRLKKSDGQIDWTRPAAAIHNQVRAFQPWPGSFTHWLAEGHEPVRVILEKTAVQSDVPTCRPGSVVESEHARLIVATGAGGLRIERLQPAGKRVLSAQEFINGYRVQAGARFG